MKSLLLLASVFMLCGCSRGNGSVPANQSKDLQEIPITSKSTEAIAHFKKGRDLAENVRIAEAAQEFDAALKLDPDFVSARALHGAATPGAEGVKEMELASAQAAGLPAPERLQIQAM